MKLLLVREWRGPSRDLPLEKRLRVESEWRLVSFATKLPVDQAVRRLLTYQVALNQRYPSSVVEFTLMSVSDLGCDLPEKDLAIMAVSKIEDLRQTAAEIE